MFPPDRLIHPKGYTDTAQEEYPNHRPQEVQAGNDQDSPNDKNASVQCEIIRN